MNYSKLFDYIEIGFGDLGFIRNDYLEKLKFFDKVNVIKVITGLRRVGKSYILKQFISYLLEKGFKKENIFYIHLDDYRLGLSPSLDLLSDIFDFFMKKIYSGGDFYLFLDEIQNVLGWEKFVRTINEKYREQAHIFITGSNSNLLSSELATLLTGRFVSLEVYPFSFLDYLDFKGLNLESSLDTNKLSYFEDYLKFGALPEILKISDNETKLNYLSSLIDSILYKDIIARFQIRKTAFLSSLLRFIYSTTCSLFTINSILKYLKQDIKNLDYETVDNYVSFLINSYLLLNLNIISAKGKEILKSYKKYYAFDLGLRNVYSDNYDIEKLLENYVYLELKRRGYKLWAIKAKDYEIDFFAQKGNKKVYYQVSYTLKNKDTYEREINALLKQKDNYEKIILTLDEVNTEDRGIYIKNIINWSLDL